MAPSDKPAPNLVIPWHAILPLVLGLAGGGAGGTLLSRPVMANGPTGVTQVEVEHIVDSKLREHDEYLLQKIELLIAKDKLAAGASNP